MTDLREESTCWPSFSATAGRVPVTAVAAIAMRLADKIIGALNLQPTVSRQHSDMDIEEVAEVMTDVATSALGLLCSVNPDPAQVDAASSVHPSTAVRRTCRHPAHPIDSWPVSATCGPVRPVSEHRSARRSPGRILHA